MIKKLFLLALIYFFSSGKVNAQTNGKPSFAELHPYVGDLHSHSAYSTDGPCALPETLYDTAKARGNDFLAVTDHDYDLGTAKLACTSLGTEPNKWQKIKDTAQVKNQDGVFVALAGFEWTHNPNGLAAHINVINSANANPPGTLAAFFDWLTWQPDKNQIIAQFNHPLPADANIIPFRRDLVPIFRTIETNNFELKSIYTLFLKKGWQVAAVGYGDTHVLDITGSKTYGVWAEALTKEKILEALLKKRTFSALEPQPNAAPTVVTALRANGSWMGETINNAGFNFEIFVADPNRDINRVELVGGGPYVGGNGYISLKTFYNLGRQANLTFSFTPQDPKLFKFYYLRVFQPNNKGVEYLSSLSSPIFVEYNPNAQPTITPQPSNIPLPTSIINPTASPANPTATPTIIVGSCSSLGSSFKDRYFTYTAATQSLEWSWTNQPVFSPSVKGKVEKIKLYLSWTKNSQIKVKVISPDGQSSETISTYLSGSSGLTTKEFYFGNLPLVEPGKTYTIAIQETYGDIYIYRSGGTLTFEEWLKPCLN